MLRRGDGQVASQASTVETFASRVVKQDGVAFRFPNCRDLYRTGAMQAKEDAAGFTAADQNALRHTKRVQFELIVMT